MKFHDCMYRTEHDNQLYCRNKTDNGACDNCKDNIHLNCENYVPRNDMCLKFFQLGISEVSQYNECAEKIIYNDTEHQRKWSN